MVHLPLALSQLSSQEPLDPSKLSKLEVALYVGTVRGPDVTVDGSGPGDPERAFGQTGLKRLPHIRSSAQTAHSALLMFRRTLFHRDPKREKVLNSPGSKGRGWAICTDRELLSLCQTSHLRQGPPLRMTTNNLGPRSSPGVPGPKETESKR